MGNAQDVFSMGSSKKSKAADEPGPPDPATQLFGVPLAEAARKSGGKVPAPILVCTLWLNCEKALTQEGPRVSLRSRGAPIAGAPAPARPVAPSPGDPCPRLRPTRPARCPPLPRRSLARPRRVRAGD